jgi:hypothetical protein
VGKRIRNLLRRANGKLGALWRWMKRADGLRSTYRRAKGIRNYAANRARRQKNLARWHNDQVDKLKDKPWNDAQAWREALERHRRLRKRANEKFERWSSVRVVYRAKARKLRRKLRKRGDGAQPSDFQPWMLSGNSGNISEGTKRLVVDVVAHGGIITDTYDYAGHTPSSRHYPWNNPDGKGHAVDYVPASCSLQTHNRDEFGVGFFAELFGPCYWYIKSGGQVYNGAPFPGHTDHEHGSPFS